MVSIIAFIRRIRALVATIAAPRADRGAANIDVGKPDAANPLVRPGSSVIGKKPGG